jgi:hypothetical protein
MVALILMNIRNPRRETPFEWSQFLEVVVRLSDHLSLQVLLFTFAFTIGGYHLEERVLAVLVSLVERSDGLVLLWMLARLADCGWLAGVPFHQETPISCRILSDFETEVPSGS